MCVSFANVLVSVERLLECTRKVADDRIFFHTNYAIKIWNYEHFVIVSPDTDIFVSTLHHFSKLKYFDLIMVCFMSRKFWNIFPHSWYCLWFRLEISWSSTSNPCPHWMCYNQQSWNKRHAVREGADCYHLLYAFGRNALSDKMIADAEKFLLRFITRHDVNTFDELRFIVYPENYLEFDIRRVPPTSDNIRQHKLREYLQCYISLHSAFLKNFDLDSLEYGYRLTEDSNLVPIISTKQSIASNFPQSCNCQKCCKASVWECQLLENCGCQFCKCDASPRCKNPAKSC